MASAPNRELPELTDLLADSAWLHRFVSTLVPARDVDDLVQSTWLAALQQHAVVREPRRWLRGIAANLARMLHRQQHRSSQREARSWRTDRATATADLVAGLELQRAVSEALLALPEPTRTIVVLRYQQRLAPTAIAEQLGLQAAAVRQRLHRGRELVRMKLQQRFGSGWRGCAALFGLARAPRDATVPATVSANSMAGVAAAGVLLCGGLAGWGCLATSSGDFAPRPGQGPGTAAAMHASSEPTLAVPAVARVLVTTSNQDPPPRPAAGEIEIRGRVVAAEGGGPVAGATVTMHVRWRANVPLDHQRRPDPVSTSADGRFVVRCPPSAVAVYLFVAADERCSRWFNAEPLRTVDLGSVTMRRGYMLRGRLIDQAGLPMGAVQLEAPVDGEILLEGTTSYGLTGFPATTAADGSFVFAERVPTGRLQLRCATPGVELEQPVIDVAAQLEPIFTVLQGTRLPAIRGVVFGADGAPCSGVLLVALDPKPAEPALCPLDQKAPRAPKPTACAHGVSGPDGAFELFGMGGHTATVRITVSPVSGHEIAHEIAPCAWGTSGLRVEVRPLVPVALRVVERGTGKAVERFGIVAQSRGPKADWDLGSPDQRLQEDGVFRFAGLAVGTRIVVFPADPMLPHAEVFVDEGMRAKPEVLVELARLQPFRFSLLDAGGLPVAGEFHVLDRCGAAEPHTWYDPRSGQRGFFPERTPLRLSSATCDAQGQATLLAPVDSRELVVAVPRGDREVWLPLVLLAPGQPVRLMLPQ